MAHEALSIEAKIRVTQLTGERNSLMPINKLPFELTVAVLLYSITPEDYQNVGRLQKLAQVQTSWWHIIRSHPRFWNTIHVGNFSAAKLRLHKSGALPLTIVCRLDATTHGVRSFLLSLEPHRSRVLSIQYRQPTIEPARNLLSMDMPRLEELVVIPVQDIMTGSIQFPQPSRLKHLHLKDVVLRWGNMQFPHLETLILSGYETFPISLSEFAEGLRSCSRLKRMSLEYLEAERGNLPPADPIVLPRLQSLTATDVGHSFLSPLISIIQAECLTHFDVSYIVEDIDGGPVARELLNAPSPPSLTALMRNPALKLRRITLEIEVNGLKLLCKFAEREASLRLSMLISDMGWMRELGSVPLLDCAVPFHVTVYDEAGDDRAHRFVVNLVPFTGMTKLELSCGPRLAAAITPTLFGDMNQWPCTKLEEIHAGLEPSGNWRCGAREWDEMSSALTELLEKRNSEAARAAGVTKLTLYVDDRPVTKAEEVRQVVADFVAANDIHFAPRTLMTNN